MKILELTMPSIKKKYNVVPFIDPAFDDLTFTIKCDVNNSSGSLGNMFTYCRRYYEVEKIVIDNFRFEI
tara:strand:- start:235 stop:441 length:207 start_codon:yes stop_codon:yes gene_type:complete